MTLWPNSSKRSQRWDPRNPLPPVTRILMEPEYRGLDQIIEIDSKKPFSVNPRQPKLWLNSGVPEVSSRSPLIRFGKFVPSGIANLISKHSSGVGSSDRMFIEQFNYGHREILLQYMELDFSHQFIGNLQHGAYPPDYQVDYRTPRYLWGRNTKFWVFSKLLESDASAKGLTNVLAIGAPWTYLPREILFANTNTRDKSNRVLIMPMHSQGDSLSQSTFENKRKRAKLFRSAVGNREATVCLHYFDYLDIDTRKLFEDAGFRVTCLGLGSIPTPWSNATSRITFLPRLMKLMSEHRYYLTDGFGTSLFYAIDSGMQVSVEIEIGSELSLGRNGIKTSSDSEQQIKKDTLKFLESNMPNTLGGYSESNEYLKISNEWLGRDCHLSPKDLRDVMDYRRGVYPNSTERVW